MKNPKPFLELAWRMELTLRVMRTFSVDHPRVEEPLAGAMKAFRELISGRLELQIVPAPDRLFINDEPLDAAFDVNVAHLHQQMVERGIAGFVLGRGLDAEELRAVLGLLALSAPKVAAQGGAAQVLGRARVRHVKLAEVRYQPVRVDQEVGHRGEGGAAPGSKPPMKPAQYDAIRQKLQDMGLSVERLDDYLSLMSWDHLNQEDRLRLVQEGERIFELPPDFILGFLRDLLESRKPEAFQVVMARLGQGLLSDSGLRRARVADQFAGIADLVRSPGLSPALEKELLRLLRLHFTQERDPAILQRTCEALGTLVLHWIEVGDLPRLNALFKDLGGSALLWVPGAKAWKEEALQGVLAGLARPDRFVHLLPFLYEGKREDLVAQVYPLLARMGEPGAKTLLHFLDGDTTQGQRRRLIEALRAIGSPALGPLRKALQSPHWHLVRNVINTLRDLGDLPDLEAIAQCLHHSDSRVRATAARAMRDLGAGAMLFRALPLVPADTQVEVALGLGHLHYLEALPAILEMASKGPQPRRLEAIRALGLMGSPEAAQALGDFLRPKGLRLGGEPLEIRLAAAKALRAIGSLEALDALDEVIAESPGELRERLMAIRGI